MVVNKTLNPLEIREEFPILREDESGNRVVYLDSAASSQKPQAVLAALDNYYTHDNANVHRGVYELATRSTDAYDRAREQLGRFFNVTDTAQLIFVRNTTEAINLVARTWADANLGPGDVILLTRMEHHSNLIPWQMAAERTGCRLEFMNLHDNGTLDLSSLDSHLKTGDVRLVAFNQVSNMLGTINPVAEITRRAHQAGAVVLVDGAQGAPHMPVDLTSLDVDFYACSAHKMCGPMGSGLLYGKREILESMPAFLGGGDMIRTVGLRSSTWADIPAKFEAGTPSVADAVGFGAACNYLSDIGMDVVQNHEHELTTYAYRQLLELPELTIYGPDADERAGVISFNVNAHPHDVASILDESSIAVRAGHHCTQPLHDQFDLAASVRASFYIYNTFEDVDRLVHGLRRVRSIFGLAGA